MGNSETRQQLHHDCLSHAPLSQARLVSMGLLRIRAEAEYKALNVGSVNDRWKQLEITPGFLPIPGLHH